MECLNDNKKNRICRVCLKYNFEGVEDKVISVFENYNNIVICAKINDIVNINIREGDGLPDKICFLCLQSLETAYEFKQKCEHSDNILRSAIQAGAPLHEDIVEDLVKVESYEEGPFSPTEYPSDDEVVKYELPVINIAVKKEDTEQLTLHNKPFKSKAIDLHLECHDCGQFFKSKCKLKVHWKKDHLPSHLTCLNCKKIFGSFERLHHHMKHRTKQCKFASKINIVGMGKSRVYHCLDCEYKTSKMQSMYAHWELHSGKKNYACEICGKSFAQASGLFNHQAGVHKIGAKEGTCQYCGKHFVSHRRLNSHMKVHTDIPQPCKICNKVLKSKNILQVHMKRHSNMKNHTCEICSKSFYTTSDLSNHREKAHIKSKLFKCDQCQYETRNYNCMRLHKKRHTDDNIACNICGTFVNNEQQLAIHKLRHNKTCECMYCHKMFYRQTNLNAHMRNIHKIKQINKSNILLVKVE